MNTMTTNEITAGVPTAAELEVLANALFPDFDAERCANGIENISEDILILNGLHRN